MPQIDIDGANSKISADKIEGQSGTTVTVTAGHNLAGSGSGLTALNATNVTSGTLPMARLSGTLPALNGSALTNLPASSVTAKVIGATYDMSTASGTQDITGFGFQPSAVHAFMFINVTDDWCHSFTDFTANRAMHAASTTTAVVYGSVAFGLVTTTADNVRQTANPVAAISDGIRLTWTKQNSPTGTLQQYFIGYK